MNLSQSQRKELQEELQPLLQPYFDHQGWPGLDAADTATQVLVDMFREMGVRILWAHSGDWLNR